MKWISVKKKLPTYGSYIVWRDHEEYGTGVDLLHYETDDGGSWVRVIHDRAIKIEGITHYLQASPPKDSNETI